MQFFAEWRESVGFATESATTQVVQSTLLHRCWSTLTGTWRTSFEELSIREVRAKIRRILCFLHTEAGVMAVRSPISLDIKHKKYTGEYEIDRGVLYVFFEGRNKSSAVTGPNPELLARLLLIELVFQAPSWREPNTLSSDSFAG